MIRTTIVLDSWGLGFKKTELGMLDIINDGTGTATRGNYDVHVRGKTGRLLRAARVENWPRKSKPVFALIAAGLKAAGY